MAAPTPDILAQLGNFAATAGGKLALAAAGAALTATVAAVLKASSKAHKAAQALMDVLALAKPAIDRAAASPIPALQEAAAVERGVEAALTADGITGDATRALTVDLPEAAQALADAMKPAASPPATPAK